MRKPFLGAFGIASTIVVAILLVELVSSNPSGLPGSEGSGAGVTETKGPPRKTAWGEPDLQGIWTDNYAIPLQRPSGYAGKAGISLIPGSGKPTPGARGTRLSGPVPPYCALRPGTTSEAPGTRMNGGVDTGRLMPAGR